MHPFISHHITLLPHGSTAQDFSQEAKISDQLLAHFNQTWEDRQIYYMARERSKVQKDLLTVIIDSYDHAKLSLPKFPMSRTPKRAIYENTRRILFALTLTSDLQVNLWFFELTLNTCYFETKAHIWRSLDVSCMALVCTCTCPMRAWPVGQIGPLNVCLDNTMTA